jgi:hypothetical protein
VRELGGNRGEVGWKLGGGEVGVGDDGCEEDVEGGWMGGLRDDYGRWLGGMVREIAKGDRGTQGRMNRW